MLRKIILMYSTHRPGPAHPAALAALGEGLTVVSVDSEEDALREAVDAEVIIGHRYLRQCLSVARSLKWVQSTAGGINHLPLQQLVEKRVMLTRCSAPSEMIARHAYTMAWVLLRNLPAAVRGIGISPAALCWLPRPKVALILGMGRIGCELAGLLKRDGIEVWGVKRRPGEGPFGCDRLLGVDQWMKLLPEVDLCFLCLPFTPETRLLMNAAALKRLPDHAVVINVGRGETLDEAALSVLLKDGKLGGAALDVLAPDSPFLESAGLEHLNLIISPHIASHYRERAWDLEQYVERQVSAYLHQEPLQDMVDLSEIAHD